MSGRSLRLFEPRRWVRVDADGQRGGLLGTSVELQATATVLVMLGLIEEDAAERVLVEHRQALDALGVEPVGELTVRPTSAYRFQAARRRPKTTLAQCPVTAAAPHARVGVDGWEVLIEWLVVARGGLRGGAVITWRGGHHMAGGGRLPAGPLEVRVPCVDDTGDSFVLRVGAGQRGVLITPAPWADAMASSAEVSIEPALPVTAAWIELRPAGSLPVRIDLRALPVLPSGRSEPIWATPAEWFLNDLMLNVNSREPGAMFGLGLDAAGALGVVGAVADTLLAVGALPATSVLLSEYSCCDTPWYHEVTRRYTARVNRDFAAASGPRAVAAVGAGVPLEHTVAVFDAVVVEGQNVWLQCYVFPDAGGEYWPVALRAFEVHATDDVGHRYRTVPATRWWRSDHEGVGDLWLWPPLDPAARSLRLTVTTPWEAAWTEIPLPAH